MVVVGREASVLDRDPKGAVALVARSLLLRVGVDAQTSEPCPLLPDEVSVACAHCELQRRGCSSSPSGGGRSFDMRGRRDGERASASGASVDGGEVLESGAGLRWSPRVGVRCREQRLGGVLSREKGARGGANQPSRSSERATTAEFGPRLVHGQEVSCFSRAERRRKVEGEERTGISVARPANTDQPCSPTHPRRCFSTAQRLLLPKTSQDAPTAGCRFE